MAAKILVVDHNQAPASMLRSMLATKGGYQAEAVCRGSEGPGLMIVAPMRTPSGTIRRNQPQAWRRQARQALT